MPRYSIEERKKYVKIYGFASFTRNLSDKCGKKLLDNAAKTEVDALKNTSKKLVYKTAEATGKFIGNKIADKIVKPRSVPEENWRNVKDIVIHQKKEKK